MELRSGRRLRSSSEQLGVGEDRISALPEELILLVLARLRCFRAAVRTGALARRWRSLWAGLRKVFFSDMPFRSLEGALQRVPGPPPAVSLLDIRVPERRTRKFATRQRRRAHSARLRSVLRAAARLEPEELVFELPPVFKDNNSPMSFVHLPAGVEFPALETLSLSGCHVCFDSLLPSCPRLRVLRIRFNEHGFHEHLKNFMSVHSASLQELFVEAENMRIDTVDLVAPQLKSISNRRSIPRCIQKCG